MTRRALGMTRRALGMMRRALGMMRRALGMTRRALGMTRRLFLDFFVGVFYNIRMKYIELTIHTTSEASELVADILWNYTEGGVAVSDVSDVIALQNGQYGVFWDYLDGSLQDAPKSDVLVKAFLLPEREGEIPKIMQDIYACRDRAAGEIPFGTLEETKRLIDGDDWIDIWKKHFRPIHLGRIVVVPEWIEYQAGPNEKAVILDSNMAFGTGEHETTAMCVELMQDYLREGDFVLDVGCGSGILGIAAAKLGAKHCFLTDIDPVAVASAKHNAIKNGEGAKIDVIESNLVDDTAMKADLILANITAEILTGLAPAVPAHLNAGGTVILSGILPDRAEKVKAAFGAAGLFPVKEQRRGEWAALVLRRA